MLGKSKATRCCLHLVQSTSECIQENRFNMYNFNIYIYIYSCYTPRCLGIGGHFDIFPCLYRPFFWCWGRGEIPSRRLHWLTSDPPVKTFLCCSWQGPGMNANLMGGLENTIRLSVIFGILPTFLRNPSHVINSSRHGSRRIVERKTVQIELSFGRHLVGFRPAFQFGSEKRVKRLRLAKTPNGFTIRTKNTSKLANAISY